MAAEIKCALCPLCSSTPRYIFGELAMCGNAECMALFWNWTKTLDYNLTDSTFIDLDKFDTDKE